MRLRIVSTLVCATLACLASLHPREAVAQLHQEILLDGIPVENVVVGRDTGVRLRSEVQFTDDRSDLIDSDVNYARFPKRIYSSEVKVFDKDRSYASVAYSAWENSQDLNVNRWSCKFRAPLDPDAESFLYLQFDQMGNPDGPDYNYVYMGVDMSLADDIYSYLQYRCSGTGEAEAGHQLSSYVSWKPSSLLMVGGEIAGSKTEGVSGVAPWYGRLFGTIFLVPETTSLRVESQYYDTGADLAYRTVNAYIYQRIGSRSLVRLDYRYYTDTQDLTSSAWGIKVKHYFSPACSAHVGYRYYDHSEGSELDTFYAGLELLL